MIRANGQKLNIRRVFVSALGVLLIVGMLFLFSGCYSADVNVKSDGTGVATITVAKSEGVTADSVKEKIEKEIYNGVELVSGEENRITLDKITETENALIVTVSFKRIGTVGGLGKFYYKNASELKADQELRGYIKKLSNGKYPQIHNYDDSFYDFVGRSTRPKKELAVLPKTIDGKELTVDEFIGEDGKDNAYTLENDGVFFSFFIAGFEGLESVTFKLNGKITVIAGDGAEVQGENTIVVKPLKIKTENVTRMENGEPVVVQGEETTCFFGYAYFIRQKNNLPLILGIICGAVLIGGILAGIFTGYFKKVVKGPKFRQFIRNYDLYLMMLPAFILLLVFVYKPMLGITIAFKNYKAEDGIFGSETVGLKNFIDVLTLPGSSFWMLAKNTVILALLKFVFGFICTIGLALLFSYLKNGWFKKTVQTISYFPYFISWVVISGIAWLFLATDTGILNKIVGFFGGKPIKWYETPDYWYAILTFTAMWKTTGYGTIVYLAGITSIDPALYEAAVIDGAGRWKQFLYIVLPGLTPIIGVQMIFSLGNLVRDDFDQIYTMTGGGNSYLLETTEVIGAVVFKATGNVASYSSAMAMNLMQSLASLGLVLGSNVVIKKMGMQSLF